jgi:hypothetical protein
LEMLKIPGDVVRLEFQLKKRRGVPDGLWNGSNFDFRACYSHYRHLALGFMPRALPTPQNWPEFLAWIHASRVTVDGIRPLDAWLAGKNDRSRRRIKAQVRRSVCQEQRVSFAELLPADVYPEWVDVVADGSAEAVEVA